MTHTRDIEFEEYFPNTNSHKRRNNFLIYTIYFVFYIIYPTPHCQHTTMHTQGRAQR